MASFPDRSQLLISQNALAFNVAERGRLSLLHRRRFHYDRLAGRLSNFEPDAVLSNLIIMTMLQKVQHHEQFLEGRAPSRPLWRVRAPFRPRRSVALQENKIIMDFMRGCQ